MIKLLLAIAVIVGSAMYLGILDPYEPTEAVEIKKKPLEEVLKEAIIAKKILTAESLDTQIVERYKQLDVDVMEYYADERSRLSHNSNLRTEALSKELREVKIKLNDCTGLCSVLSSNLSEIESKMKVEYSELEEKLHLLDDSEARKRDELKANYMDNLNKLVLGGHEE